MAIPFAFSTLNKAAIVLACAALSACSYVLLPPNVLHVAPTSTSLAEANRKLADAVVRRAAVEAEFAASEQVCYKKFFVNSCLEKAREKRREALAVVRSIEVEAELYQRRDKADARDRALVQTQKEFDADAAQRAANPRPERVVEEAPPAPQPIAAQTNRPAANAAKLKRIAEKEQAEAGQRAQNAANFEKKRQDSARREAQRRKRQEERESDNN